MPASRTGSAREWMARAALLAGSTALALLIAEGALRVAGLPRHLPGYARIANTKGADVRAGTVALVCYPTNPRGYFAIDLGRRADLEHYTAIGMRNLDKVTATQPFAVEHRYNSLVFRGDEFPPRRPGVRRIAVIGDSFTEGWGVHEEDAYPRVLDRLLGRAEPGRWEVLNCGRANADFPALFMQVFKKALDLDPDVVIYGMTLNDPVQSGRVAARRPGRFVETTSSRWRPRLLEWADQDWQRYQLTRDSVRWYQDILSDDNFNGWAETKSYIRAMKELTEARGKVFMVALWPMLIGLEGEYPLAAAHDKIAHYAGNAGIELHDLLPAFRGRTTARLWVHPVDVHPNEVAHRIAAETLVPFVRAHGAQVAERSAAQ